VPVKFVKVTLKPFEILPSLCFPFSKVVAELMGKIAASLG